MPYTQWIDVNPALKGIRPKITLGQANTIASWADKMPDTVVNKWATAINTFKKSHTVRSGKWVKRSELKKENKPMEKTVDEVKPIEEIKETPAIESYDEPVAVPFSALTFKQLDDIELAADQSAEVMEVTQKYTRIVENIMWSSEVADKVGSLKSLFEEYILKLEAIGVKEQAAEKMTESLAEANEFDVLEFTEAQPTEKENTLVYVDIVPIQPGWGNKRDNHYYPRPMLESCSQKFIGAKMYESDHRDEEKSTRTWVSTITEMKGFTPDGAPIARVAVHDPNFAERLRNLKAGGLLGKMECSILANGTVKPGYSEGERTGKIVEEISDVISVDWVTRAGAGGRVLAFAENDTQGGINMTEETKVESTPVEKPQDEVKEKEIIQEVKPEEVAPLALAEVMAELKKTDLLPASQMKLLEGTYKDVAEIGVAVEAEKKYLEEVYQSGRVTSLGAIGKPENTDVLKTVSEAKNALSEKAFGRK